MKRVYSRLRGYMLRKATLLMVIRILANRKPRLIVDETILPVANVNRARTQRIKRFTGKVFWTKRQRKLYNVYYERRAEFEEVLGLPFLGWGLLKAKKYATNLRS